jgi:hypothetical protein
VKAYAEKLIWWTSSMVDFFEFFKKRQMFLKTIYSYSPQCKIHVCKISKILGKRRPIQKLHCSCPDLKCFLFFLRPEYKLFSHAFLHALIINHYLRSYIFFGFFETSNLNFSEKNIKSSLAPVRQNDTPGLCSL